MTITLNESGIDPHVAALLKLKVLIEEGADLSIYLRNDQGQIIINDDGDLIKA